MKELIKEYQTKIKETMKLISKGGNCIELTVLGTKLQCYREFIEKIQDK